MKKMKTSQELHLNYPAEGVKDMWRLCRLKKIVERALLYGKRGSILLDIGCNDCATADFLGKDTFEYVGLDVSREALGKGIGKQRILCDANRLPIKDEAADLAICAEVIEHVDQPGILVGEISRVLNKNARLFISTPNSGGLFSRIQKLIRTKRIHNWCYFEYHLKIYNPCELDRLLRGNGFGITQKMRSIAIPPFNVTKKKRVFQVAGFFSKLVPPDFQELLIWVTVKNR